MKRKLLLFLTLIAEKILAMQEKYLFIKIHSRQVDGEESILLAESVFTCQGRGSYQLLSRTLRNALSVIISHQRSITSNVNVCVLDFFQYVSSPENSVLCSNRISMQQTLSPIEKVPAEILFLIFDHVQESPRAIRMVRVFFFPNF